MPVSEKVSRLEKENEALLARVKNIEIQIRSCDVIIHYIAETTFAEAASVAIEPTLSETSTPRADITLAVLNCT